MIHTRLKSILVALGPLTLAACGGGTGADFISSTPPTPNPSSSRGPIPPKHFALVSSTPFAVLATGDTFTTDAQGQQPTPATPPAPKSVQFSYDPVGNSYKISLPDYQPGTLTNTSYGGSVGQVATGSLSQVTAGASAALQNVTVDLPVPGSSFSPYSYTSFGSWTGTAGSTNNQVLRSEGIFAYGIPTAPGDVPTTGSATYTAQILASRGVNSSPEINGIASLLFNFAGGTLSGWMHPKIEDNWDNIHVDFGQFDFTNTVYSTGSTTFSGQLSQPGLASNGVFGGNFTGPGAAELMANFQVTLGGQQGTIAGVWVGKKN